MHAAPPPIVAPAPHYGFRKAELGMSEAEWRASAPWRAAATCVARDASTSVCRAPEQPLGTRYRTRDLTSIFREGRLAAIAYTTSIDAFADAVAELRHAYGDPTRIGHDRATTKSDLYRERVVMSWENGRSTIRLTDPVGGGGRLQVAVFRNDAAALAPHPG